MGVSDDENFGVLSSVLHGDGSQAKDLWCEGPGAAFYPWRIDLEAMKDGRCHPSMNGRQIFVQAMRRFPESIMEALDKAGHSLDEVAMIIPHQANTRILHGVADTLKVPLDKMFINIQKFGNTTGASVPLALWEARAEGRIQPGDLVVLVAFGSGLTWGANVIRW
jgi:3-oxoacyl-[acyl-carrier-protein] synthase-3